MQFKYKIPAIYSRKGIPFFLNKTESEFKKDPYERFYDTILPILNYSLNPIHYSSSGLEEMHEMMLKMVKYETPDTILELGAGIGNLTYQLSRKYSSSTIFGIEMSYQMAKISHQLWVEGKGVEVDLAHKGFSPFCYRNSILSNNLKFFVADALNTPFYERHVDLVISSFLLDRVLDPSKLFLEIHRILRKGGEYIFASPLNFNKRENWKRYFPFKKLMNHISSIGFEMLESGILDLRIPIDGTGNYVCYKVYLVHLIKI